MVQSPRYFKDIKQLPVNYYSNFKAWMTSTIFKDFMLKWDKNLNKKIVLLLDNCMAHIICEINTHTFINMKNIKLVFLPANTTSNIQPRNQDIIMSFKSHYRKAVVKKIIDDIDSV